MAPQFSCSVLVPLALLGLLAGAAAAARDIADGGGCEVSALAADVSASCAAGAATSPCCEPLLASVELGGGACLCRLALEPRVLHAGLNSSTLAALYAGCGGSANTLAACHVAAPSGSTVLALPSDGAGAHLASVAKDRVGGAPETSSASFSGLSVPVSPTDDVIKVIVSLSSDDRNILRSTISWDLIGVFVVLFYVAIQICRCIYYGCKG